jgi:mono/diheme cytochrome c family protein
MMKTKTHQAVLIAILLLLLTSFSVLAQGEGGDEDLIEEGARLYAENCAVCHGVQGEGRVGVTLNDAWPSIRPDLAMRPVIEQGVPGSPMPAFAEENGGPLNDAQIDALVEYIFSWQEGDPIVFTPVTPTPYTGATPVVDVEGDPVNGAYLFDKDCEVCHGEQGVGRIGAVLAKDWPSIRPNLFIRDAIAEGVEGSPMPAWSQDNGGPLTDTEINDLVAYILSWDTAGEEVSAVPTQSPPVPDRSNSWLAGWGGIIVFIVLFGLAIAIIMYIQMRNQPSE